eukprot:350509-Rhodomonas_salina.1
MRCPVLTYGVSCDVEYPPTRACGAVSLRGSEYAPACQVLVLTQEERKMLRDVQYCWPRLCSYAMSGTDLVYAATRPRSNRSAMVPTSSRVYRRPIRSGKKLRREIKEEN